MMARLLNPPSLRAAVVGWCITLGIGLILAPARSSYAQSLHEQIDQYVAAGHAGPFAARASDAEFIRRIWIDLAGMGPTAATTRAFLDDPSPDKRQRAIDLLLASPQFARRMQYVFDEMLMERRPDVSVQAAEWREYLRRSVLDHKPLNELCAEILTADGNEPALRPAAKFYLDRSGDLNLLTRDVARVFFGMDIQCAQCHDHPLIPDYLQEDYYGLSAFFNRSFPFGNQNARMSLVIGEKAEGEVNFKSVFVSDDPEHVTGPHVPGEAPMPEPKLEPAVAYVVAPADGVRPVPRFSRRSLLAAATTGGQNADFNRNLANRVWAILMGRGIVHPVDFHHGDNPASHPELLEVLSTALVATGYDLRALLREIALSETYQRSSELPEGFDEASIPPRAFAVAKLKPLSPEQLAWSALQAVGHVEAYRSSFLNQVAADSRLAELYAADDRRAVLHDEMAESFTFNILHGYGQQFASLFAGAPGPGSSDSQATVHQALFIANGNLVSGLLGATPSSLSGTLAKASDTHVLAEDLYLSILCRLPSREEELEIADYLADRTTDRPAALQELVWALLASGEFRFNH
ncbi:MAG: DUF1549 domain-containing protein [Pirellulales bacterium]